MNLIDSSQAIRNLYHNITYDHRPFLPERDRNFERIMTEEFRVHYACFKYAVAQVLNIERVIEIGIGSGTAALAFLHACPYATYIGIDDNSKCREDNWDFTDFVDSWLNKLNFKYKIVISDTAKLTQLPYLPATLIHIDGGHTFDCVLNDMNLALKSRTKWILADDCLDPSVVLGLFSAIKNSNVECEWSYFEDTSTGNILFFNKTAERTEKGI